MKSMKFKFAFFILVAGLLSACGSRLTQAPSPVSQPTGPAASATATATNPPTPTNTAVPTDTAAPTETTAPTETPTSNPAAQTASVSFANDVLPILRSRCVNCHGGDRIEEGLILKSYAELMAGSDNGAVVAPGDSENSLLADLISSQKMPKRGPKLTPPQTQIIIDWIEQGALNN